MDASTETNDAPITAEFVEILAADATPELPAGWYIRGLAGRLADSRKGMVGPFGTFELAQEGAKTIIADRVAALLGLADLGDGTDEGEFISEDEAA